MNNTTEKTFNQESGETIKALAEAVKNNPDGFSRFEKGFIQDSANRVEKYGENTFFSEKQSALIAKIHKERAVDGKAPGDK